MNIKEIKEAKTISIYDRDLHQYLSKNEFTTTALEEYLHYRNDECLGEWWVGNDEIAPIFNKIFNSINEDDFNEMYDKLFEFWVSEVVKTESGIRYVLADMHGCNFEAQIL